jgi:ubiquinone/menaquinone biosynthesis C-methylase UbiE
MLEDYTAEHISVLGTSSGGNLALGMVPYINDGHGDIPMPGYIMAISPGTCVDTDEEWKRMLELDRKDVAIPAEYMKTAVEIMRHGDESVPDYMIWLQKGDFTNCPRVTFIYGSDETLYACAPSFEAAMQKYGVDYEMIVGDGMFHCYPVFPVCREGRDGWDMMIRTMREQTHGDGNERNGNMTRRDQIKNAYRLTGDHASFYDGMMTYSTLPGKAICRLVWNMDGKKNLRYLERALSGVPEGFKGKLLEVPVGTGVLSMPVYKELPEADITCLDYSADMMHAAQAKAETAGIRNITFLQGDVSALPFEDGTFDVVLSLNGFHAFPDKEAAYRETFRVLKKGGTFCGCFYVRGGCGRTDWMINHLYQPKGYFTPPYETEQSLRERLEKMYTKAKVTSVEGIACFRCRK